MRSFFVGFGFLGLVLLMQATDQKFWSKLDSSKWTSVQVIQFMTASPWAKQARATLISNDSNMAASAPPSAGRGRTSRVTNGSAEPVTMPNWEATVRWASAKPMQQLLKAHLPGAFDGHYVISVSGLPIGGDATELLEQTTLQLKRGETIHPQDGYQDPGDTSTIYFAFLPSMVEAADGKVVVFRMVAAPYEITAKFNFAEMKIMGAPAL